MPVTCEAPPKIANGNLTSEPGHSSSAAGNYSVGSVVSYECNKHFTLQGNGTSECMYSGLWSPIPVCKRKHSVTGFIAGGVAGIIILEALVATILVLRWKSEQKRVAAYFENQPFEKRNRRNDAFVSFTGDEGLDMDFVRHTLQPQLEVESNPPFKLTIHLRDFEADTLIYVNIRRAVENSNSAIIIMSQEYVNSRWCREEFEVRGAKNRVFCFKVASYRAAVCVMRFCGITDSCVRTFLASRIDWQRLSAEATCGTLGVMLNFATQKKGQANLLPQKIYMKSASRWLQIELLWQKSLTPVSAHFLRQELIPSDYLRQATCITLGIMLKFDAAHDFCRKMQTFYMNSALHCHVTCSVMHIQLCFWFWLSMFFNLMERPQGKGN